MKIYTSYFANARNIPRDIALISISLYPPKGYGGLEYKQLAPTRPILESWKQNYNQEEYIINFQKDVLSRLDPKNVYNYLYSMTGGRDCALLCFEKPEDFCHRHLVAEWFAAAGYEVKEYPKKGKAK